MTVLQCLTTFLPAVIITSACLLSQVSPRYYSSTSIQNNTVVGGIHAGHDSTIYLRLSENELAVEHQFLYHINDFNSLPSTPIFKTDDYKQIRSLSQMEVTPSKNGAWVYSKCGLHFVSDNGTVTPLIGCLDSSSFLVDNVVGANGLLYASVITPLTKPVGNTVAYYRVCTVDQLGGCSNLYTQLPDRKGVFNSLALTDTGLAYIGIGDRLRDIPSALIRTISGDSIQIKGLSSPLLYNVQLVRKSAHGWTIVLSKITSSLDHLIIECDESFNIIKSTELNGHYEGLVSAWANSDFITVTTDSTVIIYSRDSESSTSIELASIKEELGLSFGSSLIGCVVVGSRLYIALNFGVVVYDLQPTSVSERNIHSSYSHVVGEDESIVIPIGQSDGFVHIACYNVVGMALNHHVYVQNNAARINYSDLWPGLNILVINGKASTVLRVP